MLLPGLAPTLKQKKNYIYRAFKKLSNSYIKRTKPNVYNEAGCNSMQIKCFCLKTRRCWRGLIKPGQCHSSLEFISVNMNQRESKVVIYVYGSLSFFKIVFVLRLRMLISWTWIGWQEKRVSKPALYSLIFRNLYLWVCMRETQFMCFFLILIKQLILNALAF